MSHYSPHDPSRSPPLVPLPSLDPSSSTTSPYHTAGAPTTYPIHQYEYEYEYDSPYDPRAQQYRPPHYAPPPPPQHYLYPTYAAQHPATTYHPSPDYRPQSPYDPAIPSTAAYEQQRRHRAAASPSSPAAAAAASPHFDLDQVNNDDDEEEEERERERQEIERQVGRREIEERERAAWSKQPVAVAPRQYRRPSSSSSPECQHRLGGFHTITTTTHLVDGAAQDLDDLLRAVRGDLTPQRQQPQQQHYAQNTSSSSSSSSSLPSKPATSLPWQQQQQVGERSVEEEEGGGGRHSNSPSSPAASSTALRQSQQQQQQQRGNAPDGYDPAAPRRGWSSPTRVTAAPAPTTTTTEEEEIAAAAAAAAAAARPRKRTRVQSSDSSHSHSHSPPRMGTEAEAEERPERSSRIRTTAAERACLSFPRRSVLEYARRHELAVDAEARIVEGEIVLGERRRFDAHYEDDDEGGDDERRRVATTAAAEVDGSAAAEEEEAATSSDGREHWTLFGERLHSLAPSTQVLMARAMRDITYPDRLKLYDHAAARSELERTVPWFVTLLTTIQDRYELAGASSIAPQDPPAAAAARRP
ncbi:hypothetical protein RHOSPDRAFT_33490 [Rhodotorula sp. JG-1b]|nr:hypothetical protein RHOSPDRAFT_33490 [Rhodotorula sp. JG-1b]